MASPVSSKVPVRYPLPPDSAHFRDARVGSAWYSTDFGCLVVRTSVDQATPVGARILCDWVDWSLNRDRANLEAHGGLLLFHDWRSIKGYESGTREHMLERMRARPRGYARKTVMVIDGSPLMKMAITVADVTFALFGGRKTEVFHDIQKAVRELDGISFGPPPSWLSRPA